MLFSTNRGTFSTMSQRMSLVVIFLFLVPCLHALIDPSMFRRNFHPESESEGDLYVFPSMRMDRVVSVEGAPVVEVTYHGKPPLEASPDVKTQPLLPTPVPNRGKVRPPRRKRPHNKPVTKTTPVPSHDSTWNPDNFDHTVNPNKSRKTTRPTPAMKRPVESDNQEGVSSRELPPYDLETAPTTSSKRFPKMESKFKDILTSSNDFKAWQDLKSNFMKSNNLGNDIHQTTIQDILATEASKNEDVQDLTTESSSKSELSFPNFPPRQKLEQSIKVTPLPNYDHTTQPPRTRPKKAIPLEETEEKTRTTPIQSSTTYRGLTVRPRKSKSHNEYSPGIAEENHEAKSIVSSPESAPEARAERKSPFSLESNDDPSPFAALPEGFGIPKEPIEPSAHKDPFAGLGPGPRPTPNPLEEPESPYSKVFAELGVTRDVSASPYSSPYAGSGLANPDEHHPPKGPNKSPPRTPRPREVPTHRPQPIIVTPSPTRKPTTSTESEADSKRKTKPPIKKKTTKTFLNYPSKENMIPPMTTPKPFLSIVTPEPSVTLSSLHQEVSPYDIHEPTRAPPQSHANSSPRVPRDYSTSQVLQTPESVSIHHSTATAHPSPLGGVGAKSFQSITIVHPKTKLDQAQANEIESHRYTNHHDEKKKSYLPQHITLHTTASPAKKDLPPHLKNEDTVVLSLPNLKPTDIPDGYELIPLDQLTPEYEVVPWNEARKVLNVTVSSLGEPKPKEQKPRSRAPPSPTPSPFAPSHSTFAPSYYHGSPSPGEPQSGYNSLDHDYPILKSTPKPKRNYENEGQPIKGYGLEYEPHQEEPWNKNPPPISPDLPLFYGDKGNKGQPSPYELHSESEKPRPVVKGLEDEGYSSPYSNVIHFGTDFAHKDAHPYPPGHPHYKSLQVFHSVHTTKSPHQVKTIVPHLSTTTAPGGYYPTVSPIHHGIKNSVAYFSTPRPTGYGHSTPKPSYENPSSKPAIDYSAPSPYENYLEPDHESPYGYPEYPEEPKSSLKPYYESSPKPEYEEASKPSYHSSPKPSYESPKPHYHSTPQPNYEHHDETPDYNYVSSRPDYHSPEIHNDAQPHYHSTPKPSYESPKPHYHSSPKPSYESPKPHYHSTPKPSYESPKPHYHSSPKPSYESPKPQYHSTLKPSYEKPSYEVSPSGYDNEPHYHSTPKPTYDETPHYFSSPKPSYEHSGEHYHSPDDSSHERPKPSYDSYESHEDPEPNYHTNPEPLFETHEIEHSPYDEAQPMYGVEPEHTTERPSYHPEDIDEDIPHYQANLRPKDEPNPNHVTPPDHEGFKSSEPDPYYTSPKPSYKHPKSLLSAFKYMPLTSPFNEIYKPIFSHNSTPRPPTPTTSVYPYLHWSSPKPQQFSGGPEVHIQHSTPKGTSHENHVKSLTPTPHPGHASSHYSTPQPSYHSTPQPSYHSTPNPSEYGPSVTPAYPHTTTGPPRGYYSGSPTPYGYSPSPNSVHYHSSTTPAPIRVAYSATPGPSRDPSYVKGLDLSHLRLYTPTPPRPRYASTPFPQYSPSPSMGYSPSPSVGYSPTPSYGYSPSPSYGYSPTPSHGYSPSKPPLYSPTTQKSMVKSLPEFQQANSPYMPHFVSYQEQYYLPKRSYNPNEYIPQDIPLKVNHFPEIVPTPSPLKMAFYTSPQPVYVPGPTKNLSHLPQYQPTHSRQELILETGPQSEVRMQQLQKYLSSIDQTDPKSHLDTDILSQLINTLTNNDPGQKIKISIPTHPPENEKHENPKFDIAALQRQPEKANPLKFASKLFKRKINSGDLSKVEIEELELEMEALHGSEEDLNNGKDKQSDRGKPDLNAQESRSNESDNSGEEEDEWIIRPLEEKEPIPFLEVSKQTTLGSSTTQSTTPTTTTFISSSSTTTKPLLEREESALFELFEKFLRDKITSTSTTKGHPTRPSVVYIPEASTTTAKPDEEDSSEEVMKMRISSYDNVSGNNIIIGNNTEQTLKQLTKTLRSLTATVRGLNNTIMEATEKVRPTLEQPMALIQYMQGEIDKLTKTVTKLQSQQDGEMSKEKVKEVLLDVVKEVQKVDQLRNNLSDQGLTSARPKRKLENSLSDTTRSDIFIASDGVKTHFSSNVDWHTVPSTEDEIQALNRQNDEDPQDTSTIQRDGFSPSDPADIITIENKELMNQEENQNQAYPDIFNIPVSASLGPRESVESEGNSVGASLQVIGDENVNIRHIGDKSGIVVGTAMPVEHSNNVRNSPSRRPRLTTTPKPLRHSFNPSGATHTATSPRPNFEGGFHGSTPMSLHHGSPTPLAGNGPPIYSHWSPTPEPALNKGFAFDNQNKHVRFPVQSQVQEETDQDYDYEVNQPKFGTSYMNTLSKSATVRRGDIAALPPNSVGPTKSGVNIMAELAPPQGHRKNLLDRGANSEDPYIRPDQNNPSNMEVIMYPSGQLLKSSNPGRPPSSTIGPRLESALLNSYYRNQLPHYVLAKNRRSEFMEKDTGLFDPQYESDEVITDSYAQYEYDGEDNEPSASSKLAGVGSMIKAAAGDIFPKIVRTATDDLKLMGNVIKLALS